VSTPDPIAGIHVAVNRMLPLGHLGRSERPFLPAEALEVTVALEAYTAGAAFVNHLDDTGRIASGYAADLVVLDADLLSVPVDEIGSVRVDETFIDGRSVYRRR
jgi:predicted amidohydrolase YtcJ